MGAGAASVGTHTACGGPEGHGDDKVPEPLSLSSPSPNCPQREAGDRPRLQWSAENVTVAPLRWVLSARIPSGSTGLFPAPSSTARNLHCRDLGAVVILP